MGTPQRVVVHDVSHGPSPSRLRLLGPLRYLHIYHPEKTRYDVHLPAAFAVIGWVIYISFSPKPPLFGDAGLLRFVRDMLIMAVPFMVGSLAAVSMGAPGSHLDKRPVGKELWLDDQRLTFRQFLCYLLGYLSFLGLVTLGAVVCAGLMHDPVMQWTAHAPIVRNILYGVGLAALASLLSPLTVTVFWALYFLTDVVNRNAT